VTCKAPELLLPDVVLLVITTFPDILANPVIVVLPAARVVMPDTAPENEPVLADNTNLPVELPNSIVLLEQWLLYLHVIH